MNIKKINNFFLTACLQVVIILAGCQQVQQKDPIKTDATTEVEVPIPAVNAGFPFGCPLLTTLSFPKKWEPDPNNYGFLLPPEGQVFDSITSYYHRLNTAPVISSPGFQSVKLLHSIAPNELEIKSDSLSLYHLDSCRFRLPDTDEYECYYFSKTDPKSPDCVFGNLLFIRKDTRAAKLIQAFHIQCGEQSVKYQFFMVDKEEVSLYSGWYYDDGITLKMKSQINVAGD